MSEVTKYRLVSIDAWRDCDGGWQWNQWYTVEDSVSIPNNMTTRQLLKLMRDRGWLTDESKGRVRVAWEWDIIEIQDKNTGAPWLAFTTIHGSE